MDSIHVYGGAPLCGRLKIQGSKNAALPILAASVLVPGVSVLHNCPRIEDVRLMCELLKTVGCLVAWEGHTVIVDASGVDIAAAESETALPSAYVEKMRSSVIFMGGLLGRVGEVSLKYPGGCVIGKRPIDLHLWAMEQLGVVTRESEGGITARAERLFGTTIRFPVSSVGATENAVLAAACAEGETILTHAAKEPEVSALCSFLRSAGAVIWESGDGSIRIQGQKKLHGCEYTIPSDRIVSGTYLLGCMAAGGDICLKKAPVEELSALLRILTKMGAELSITGEELRCQRAGRLVAAGHVVTAAYPGYPTDLQSQLLAVSVLADGNSSVTETIFENRFRVVEELNRMGGNIRVEGNTAFVQGVKRLHGEHVMARELRGGAALILAGLAAEGETVLYGREYINRGYEDIAGDLQALGAHIIYEEENGKYLRTEAASGQEK